MNEGNKTNGQGCDQQGEEEVEFHHIPIARPLGQLREISRRCAQIEETHQLTEKIGQKIEFTVGLGAQSPGDKDICNQN